MSNPRYSKSIAALAGFGISLALSGCERAMPPAPVSVSAETPVDPRLRTPYELDVMDLKARETDPARIEAGIRALLARYGYPVPAAPAGPASASASPAGPDAPALAKSAATKVYRVKEFDFDYPFVIKKVIAVPDGFTLDAWTQRDAQHATVDPRLIAFYKLAQNAGADAWRTIVVGFNDDYSGLDSRFTWKNSTGASKWIYIFAFAYSASGGGNANVLTRVHLGAAAGVSATTAGSVQAVGVNRNFAIQTVCAEPAGSVIQLRKLVGGGYGSGIIAVNASTLKGGYIREANADLAIDGLIPAGGNNLLIPFFEGLGGPFYESTVFKAIQDDLWIGC